MFARTKRLLLRPPWPEDAAELVAAIAGGDIVSNVRTLPKPYMRADAARHIARQMDMPTHEAACHIYLRTNGRPTLVGGIGFGLPSEGSRVPQLNYWVTRDCWGAGIATEAGEAVLETAFGALRYPMLCAHHTADNMVAGQTFAALDFHANEDVDETMTYLLTRERWLHRRQAFREAA